MAQSSLYATREEIANLQGRFAPGIDGTVLQAIADQNPEKKPWFLSNTSKGDTQNVAFCYDCVKIYEVTPRTEVFLAYSSNEGAEVPYCEACVINKSLQEMREEK